MSSDERNYLQDQHHDQIIKAQAESDHEFKYVSLNLKSENDGDCKDPVEFISYDIKLPIDTVKKEPEDSKYQAVYDFQIKTENATLKEEMDIEDHKTKYALTGTGSNDSICNSNNFQTITEETGNGEDTLEFALVNFINVKNSGELGHDQDVCDPANKRNKFKDKQNNTKIYKCNECPYETVTQNYFAIHYKRRHSKEPNMHKCALCSYESRMKPDLKQHIRRIHMKDTEVYKCVKCSYGTRIQRNLNQHLRRMHVKQTQMYKCEECSYETKDKSYLKQHCRIKHAKQTEVYKCDECSYQTRVKIYFTQHYKYKHSEQAKVFKCEECSYETSYQSDLTRHFTCRHAKQAYIYKCKECSYETRYKSHLTRHFRLKHSKQVVPVLTG